MAGNSFGNLFRITTFGESHGPATGVVIDGCPSGLLLDISDIQKELDRRKPGQSTITTDRKETDFAEIISGVFEGKTTGAPICIIIRNHGQRSEDYEFFRENMRPLHGDYTWFLKYGHRDYRGGGRSSARETVARVAAGAVAKSFLRSAGIKVQAYTESIGNVFLSGLPENLHFSELNAVRCPDEDVAVEMIKLLETLKKAGDSTGGVVACFVRGCSAGLGEPVFGKLESALASAIMSIGAVKGFELGAGFSSAKMNGSDFKAAHTGGITGGISEGNNIFFRVAFRPVSTIRGMQTFITKDGKKIDAEMPQGRHDPCVVPRAVPVVEAMTALVLADYLLLNRSSVV